MLFLFDIGFVLLAVALILWDVRTRTLPDLLVAGVFVLGFAKAILTHAPLLPPFVSSLSLLLGTLTLKEFYARIRHKEGLGLGDVKLFGALGMWLTPPEVPLFLAFVGGMGVVCGLVQYFFTKQERFPFAPALYGGYAVTALTKTCNFL